MHLKHFIKLNQQPEKNYLKFVDRAKKIKIAQLNIKYRNCF